MARQRYRGPGIVDVGEVESVTVGGGGPLRENPGMDPPDFGDDPSPPDDPPTPPDPEPPPPDPGPTPPDDPVPA